MKRGATVILACRDAVKGQAACEAIVDATRNTKTTGKSCGGSVELMVLDLTDFASIDSFVKEFSSKYPRLDILVNNAGVNTHGVTKYGLQQLFAANYLGHYYLFRQLEPMLTSTTGRGKNRTIPQCYASAARVVNLSSVMHHIGGSKFNESAYYGTPSAKTSANLDCYSDSKLYMNYFTMEINRRFFCSLTDKNCEHEVKKSSIAKYQSGSRSISAVSANPGAVRSDIWRAVPWPIRYFRKYQVPNVFVSK